MQLGRPLGIHATTVIRTYHSITSLQQSLYNRTQVGSTLAVVAEPRTTVNMNHDGILLCLFLGQIDVTGVVSLFVAYIVHIRPLLRCLQFYLRHLESSKTSCGLCLRGNTKHQTPDT